MQLAEHGCLAAQLALMVFWSRDAGFWSTSAEHSRPLRAMAMQPHRRPLLPALRPARKRWCPKRRALPALLQGLLRQLLTACPL